MAESDEARNISLIATLSGFVDKISQFTGSISASVNQTVSAANSFGYGGGRGGGGGYSTSTPFPDSGGASFGLGSATNDDGRDYIGNYSNIKTKNNNPFQPGTTSGILGAAGNLAMGSQQILGMMLPSPEKAMYTEMLGRRMGFYNRNINLEQAYNMQTAAGQLGMATSDMDAMYASNVGISQGLLPGLNNFGPTKSFGGVMGGAALFSNLSPGVGLQGGMGAVASLNQARSVNRLRMIGINVRNDNGTGMRDIPEIIDQLYDILKSAAGEEPTEEAIAVSAMSGNALDSLLNQYFGNDDVLRQSVLAALIQKTKNKGAKMATLGTKESLNASGGLTQTAISTANRNILGTRLNQQFATPVNTGTISANNVISSLNQVVTNMSSNDFIKGVGALQSFLEVLGGAGGGAGAGLIGLLTSTGGQVSDLFGSGGSAFGDIFKFMLGGGMLLGGAAIGGNISNPISEAKNGFNFTSAPPIINVKWDWVTQGTGKK
jgi:hypothetical protein